MPDRRCTGSSERDWSRSGIQALLECSGEVPFEFRDSLNVPIPVVRRILCAVRGV